MNWFKKLMTGRYGSDQLSIALMILSLIIIFISGFSEKLRFLSFISYILLAISTYRIFSKDINRRRMENYKFVMLVSPLYAWSLKKVSRIRDFKKFKYFKCPNCTSQLRVPRGKGKVSISCPKCKTGFIGKT